MMSVGVGDDSRNCRMRNRIRSLAAETPPRIRSFFKSIRSQPPSQADSPLCSVKSNVSSDTLCQSDGYAWDYRAAWVQTFLTGHGSRRRQRPYSKSTE